MTPLSRSRSGVLSGSIAEGTAIPQELDQGAESEGGRLTSTAVRGSALYLLATAVLFAAGLIPVFAVPLNYDSAWLLYVAERVMDGERLYVDLIEINPPLIVWMSAVPVLLARLLGISEILAFSLAMIGTLVASLMLTRSVLRATFPEKHGLAPDLLLFLALFVLLPGTGLLFGEREHIMFALVVPYLCAAAAHAHQVPLPTGRRVLIGVLAGLGLALKPYFLLVWAAVEVYLVARQRDSWRRPECLAILGIIGLYAAAILIFAREYLDVVRMASGLYPAQDISWVALIAKPQTILCAVIVSGCGLLRLPSPYRELGRVLSISTLALLAAALVQQKGWTYHFYPAVSCAILLLGVTALGDRSRRSRAGRFAMRPSTYVAFLAMPLVVTGVLVGDAFRFSGSDAGTLFWNEVRIARTFADGEHIAMLSTEIAAAFPLVNYSNALLASKFPSFWILPGLYPGAIDSRAPFPYRDYTEMGELERSLLDDAVGEMIRDAPELIFIDTGRTMSGFGETSFDHREYLSRHPDFPRFFRQYTLVAESGVFEIYRRRSMSGEVAFQPDSKRER